MKLDVEEEEARRRLSGSAALSPASVSADSSDAVCTKVAAVPGKNRSSRK